MQTFKTQLHPCRCRRFYRHADLHSIVVFVIICSPPAAAFWHVSKRCLSQSRPSSLLSISGRVRARHMYLCDKRCGGTRLSFCMVWFFRRTRLGMPIELAIFALAYLSAMMWSFRSTRLGMPTEFASFVESRLPIASTHIYSSLCWFAPTEVPCHRFRAGPLVDRLLVRLRSARASIAQCHGEAQEPSHPEAHSAGLAPTKVL